MNETTNQEKRVLRPSPVRCIALAFPALTGPGNGPRPYGRRATRTLRRHRLPVTDEFADVFDRWIQRAASRSSTMTLADVLLRAIHDARMPAPGPRTANQLIREILADLPDPLVTTRSARVVRELHRQGRQMVLTCPSPRPAPVREQTLSAAQISGCFTAIVMPAVVGVAPPHPDYYRQVLQASGLPAAAEMLWVGPDIDRDVRQPLRHLMQAALVDPTGRPTGLPDDVPTLTSLAELPGLLARQQTSRTANR